ncbi:hypothetical protein DESC_660153 [Desulfosarcina cetonica]|uniref:hypothetical protein n=1 Tax=Desulfosarcina cetonica TaxID=90730 RepID=UPI0006D1A65E|nr:hypothetical protein [Desulfosarcina cetonica]VTR68026.1 hypothetical protein DESC_660153 [Desulfosarcina cetonica]
MILFRAIILSDAVRMGYRCAEIQGKRNDFSKVQPYMNDFSSRNNQHGNKLAGLPSKRGRFGRLGLFRKIHILDSRLTHRPTNRMILTSLVLGFN